MSLVPLPASLKPFLEPYLPDASTSDSSDARPFVTLTYAQSLDSRIAAKPGVQTKISHLETKTMTHYIRSKHDAILVGIGTVLADDPKLNCRYSHHKIRPVVVDPWGKWSYHTSQLRQLVQHGQGLAPYIVIDPRTLLGYDPAVSSALLEDGGRTITVDFSTFGAVSPETVWAAMLAKLKDANIQSVMVEGGARIINDLLLLPLLVDSLIVTIGPVFLGNAGVEVSPAGGVGLSDVVWWRGQQDCVMAAKP